MVSIAEENRGQVDATVQAMLVESYFAVRLGQRVVDVREQTLRSLEKHYQNALKLEANGMIDKAERLFVQVNMDEARRELESARSDLGVAQSALKAIIRVDSRRNTSCLAAFHQRYVARRWPTSKERSATTTMWSISLNCRTISPITSFGSAGPGMCPRLR